MLYQIAQVKANSIYNYIFISIHNKLQLALSLSLSSVVISKNWLLDLDYDNYWMSYECSEDVSSGTYTCNELTTQLIYKFY
jgi:hypothetical protein